ncbi:MAG: hypothetical protein IKU10_00005, partial [Clostridia bacterium]|nr:hypothetical protein [Clostridia bacterium]
MGALHSSGRPIAIQLLNVENHSTVGIISYLATYENGFSKNFRVNVKAMKSAQVYRSTPYVVGAQCLGKVYVGWIKTDVRVLFCIKLSDGTMDMIQEREGTRSCNKMLALSCESDPTIETPSSSPPERKEASSVRDVKIPVEVLENLYSLSLSNVAIKRHVTYENGKKESDYITLKCKINYNLNGRKEGKRHIIFAGYDQKDQIIALRGEYDAYHFNASGHEFA